MLQSIWQKVKTTASSISPEKKLQALSPLLGEQGQFRQ
ncbi:hypothetical protein PanWU01x14_305630 [Parasponia andersonii]|uniref:Uncharacterized protein n=1 Tax=Parasponia andersonii TaxID=3476 RepID=A0A2P5AS71_PARAD|nr:hypothetical protein PanWU01x14_305630 [Parasponia andersonii]